MIRVLRHYLPLRKALLVGSETLLLAAVLAVGMSWHLLGVSDVDPAVVARLAAERMQPDTALWRCLVSSFLLAILAQLAITLNELYDYRVSASPYERAARFVGSAGSAILVGGGAVALARLWELERILDFPGLTPFQLVQTLVFTMLCGFVVLYFWRMLFHWVLGRWHFSERVLILGAGDLARSIAAEMNDRPYVGYDAIALVPDEALVEAESGPEPPRVAGAEALAQNAVPRRVPQRIERGQLEVLGVEGPRALAQGQRDPASLFELVREMRIDLVVVALEDRRRRLPIDELLACRLAGIGVLESEEIYERVTGKISVTALRPSYLIFNEGFVRSPWSQLAKRALDIAGASLGLLVTWPVMLVVALLVKANSEGPALFTQERVGMDGQPFTLLKFRSMRADAEQESGPVWARQGDPRITSVGRFLRRSRLDELPQLFNVLAGQMSLVGPRPERPVFVQELAARIPYYNQRHIVKPGLTGWAQINYPYGSTVEDALQKLQYDLFYIKYASLLFDLSILFNTLKTVLLRKGT